MAVYPPNDCPAIIILSLSREISDPRLALQKPAEERSYAKMLRDLILTSIVLEAASQNFMLASVLPYSFLWVNSLFSAGLYQTSSPFISIA